MEETEWAIEECLKSGLPVSFIIMLHRHQHQHHHHHHHYHHHQNHYHCHDNDNHKNYIQVAATMCIGPEGDLHGNSAAECAIRMARAGRHHCCPYHYLCGHCHHRQVWQELFIVIIVLIFMLFFILYIILVIFIVLSVISG